MKLIFPSGTRYAVQVRRIDCLPPGEVLDVFASARLAPGSIVAGSVLSQLLPGSYEVQAEPAGMNQGRFELPVEDWGPLATERRGKCGSDLLTQLRDLPPLTAEELAAQEQCGRIRQELAELLSAGKITLPDFDSRHYAPKTWLMDY